MNADLKDIQNNPWLKKRGLKCVVLCAGRGTRATALFKERPKVMLQVRNKPILGYVLDYWKKYTNDFIFVVGYKKEYIINFVKNLAVNSQFVEQKELKGIASALLCTEDLVSDYFIVVLGDCLCKGEFGFQTNMSQGLGLWDTPSIKDIKQSYSVEIRDSFISKVEEKPKQVINNLCGMGFYFFNKRIFDFIKLTKPSKLRNEVELTDAIQRMINAGEKLTPVFFRGDYLNITYPLDLQKAEGIFK